MNTFLPRGSDYLRGARELDSRRLQKQLVEVQQIHMALATGGPAHILHHPATQMWLGMEQELLDYGVDCYDAYIERFGKAHKSGNYICHNRRLTTTPVVPWFVRDDTLARKHRTKLYLKDATHYEQFDYWHDRSDGPLTFYPVTGSKQQGLGSVYKVDGYGPWVVSYAPSPTFRTAWAGIQWLRQHKETANG